MGQRDWARLKQGVQNRRAYLPWPSLPTMAELTYHGRAYLPWPSLPTMAELTYHGRYLESPPDNARLCFTFLLRQRVGYIWLYYEENNTNFNKILSFSFEKS